LYAHMNNKTIKKKDRAEADSLPNCQSTFT
jgi:hypothetical protein